MGLRIQGYSRGPETGEIVRHIEAQCTQHWPMRLLVPYDPEQGLISAEDLYDNMRFAKLAGDKIAKMAVIGNPPLVKEPGLRFWGCSAASMLNFWPPPDQIGLGLSGRSLE